LDVARLLMVDLPPERPTSSPLFLLVARVLLLELVELLAASAFSPEALVDAFADGLADG
jgi:hypothetical protein